jgi:hypothetical protein
MRPPARSGTWAHQARSPVPPPGRSSARFRTGWQRRPVPGGTDVWCCRSRLKSQRPSPKRIRYEWGGVAQRSGRTLVSLSISKRIHTAEVEGSSPAAPSDRSALCSLPHQGRQRGQERPEAGQGREGDPTGSPTDRLWELELAGRGQESQTPRQGDRASSRPTCRHLGSCYLSTRPSARSTISSGDIERPSS